jgi:hypothetical protein
MAAKAEWAVSPWIEMLPINVVLGSERLSTCPLKADRAQSIPVSVAGRCGARPPAPDEPREHACQRHLYVRSYLSARRGSDGTASGATNGKSAGVVT